MLTDIIVAVLALVGTLTGAYLANRKAQALMGYRLDQLEAKVERLDVSQELARIRERVSILEARMSDGHD